MIDTHCHLDMCADGALERARAAGVDRVVWIRMLPDPRREPEPGVSYAVGYHPNNAHAFDAAVLGEEARAPGVVAIGETGLDWYRDRSPRDAQRRSFEAHLALAADRGLPVVIHMRDSAEDTFEVLRGFDGTVVLHCFSAPGNLDEAVERGWFCSFAGNVTYPKATDLQQAARDVPAELLLVETDAPFLAPQPVRGKPNEPGNVTHTARFVAELRGISYEELDALVERNAARVFGW